MSILIDKMVVEALGEDDLVVRNHNDQLPFFGMRSCLGNIFKHLHRNYLSSAGNNAKIFHQKSQEDGGTASLL